MPLPFSFHPVAADYMVALLPGPFTVPKRHFYYKYRHCIFTGILFTGPLPIKNRMELIENPKQQAALKRLDMEQRKTRIRWSRRSRKSATASVQILMTWVPVWPIRPLQRAGKTGWAPRRYLEIEKYLPSGQWTALPKWMPSSEYEQQQRFAGKHGGGYIRSYSLEYFENHRYPLQYPAARKKPQPGGSREPSGSCIPGGKRNPQQCLKSGFGSPKLTTLERVSDGLKLYIHDNGVGIDFEKLRQFGNGLKNMKKGWMMWALNSSRK